MEILLKLCLTAVVCAISAYILKQYKPEYAIFIELAGICIAAVFAVEGAQNAISNLGSIINSSYIGSDTVEILIKALFIAVVTGIASDICKDSSNSALAGTIEFLGKTVIIVLSIPLIKAVANFAFSLIKS